MTKNDFRVKSQNGILAMTTNKVFESRKLSALKRSRIRLIRQIAYEIYVNRIKEGIPGDAFSDWVQAEKKLEEITASPIQPVISDPVLP